MKGAIFGAKDGVAKGCAMFRMKRAVFDVRSENAVFRVRGVFPKMRGGRWVDFQNGRASPHKQGLLRGDAISLLLIASRMRDANGRGYAA